MDKKQISEQAQHYGVSTKLLQQILDYAEQYHLEKVILFGSRARGDFHRTSDIDLAVSGGDIANFSIDVDEMTDTLLKYDFVNLDGPVQEDLRESIQREGIIIYEKV